MSHTIKGDWVSAPEGWVYEARAIATSGRIIATAKAHLSYDVGFAVEDLHGATGKAEIEKLTKDLCERLVPESEKA